jgi:LPXTG-motif cell wall-anchored protein
MPQLKTTGGARKKGVMAPIAIGGVALAALAGWWLWRRNRGLGAPVPGPTLVASTSIGQPEIS